MTTTRFWTLLLMALLALRLPSLATPLGNDQSLYAYVASRVADGGVPYVDAWDQKPPAIYFLYVFLWRLWPDPSVVAAADLVAAGLVAWLLVLLGRRTLGLHTGGTAAALFLVFGHPSLARLGGVYIRGQCEAFIALAVTTAVVLMATERRRHWHVALAGLWLGVAFWLKYNALLYALPLVAAAWYWPVSRPDMSGRPMARAEVKPAAAVAWGAAGFALVGALTLAYFAGHGALDALRLATIDYNLRYSGETYSGPWSALRYVASMPVLHARLDVLWFLGGLGGLVLAVSALGRHRWALVLVCWIAAAVLSIAANGARDLPQYFVQAAPAFAFAAAAGGTLVYRAHPIARLALVGVMVVALWKVGVETPSAGGFRWGGLPQLAENIRFDLSYQLGHINRVTYLTRFTGAQKYDANAIADLAERIRETTAPSDRILVFGFAPGVYIASGRQSASRFFWSRPVILEFAADRPGYGSAGLLDDLRRNPPALVALQKKDWAPDVANSMDFFLGNAALADWLSAGYVLDQDTPVFSLWRRRS